MAQITATCRYCGQDIVIPEKYKGHQRVINSLIKSHENACDGRDEETLPSAVRPLRDGKGRLMLKGTEFTPQVPLSNLDISLDDLHDIFLGLEDEQCVEEVRGLMDQAATVKAIIAAKYRW